MALFGGLFAKKDRSIKSSASKQPSTSSASSSPVAERSSNDKPTLPDIDLSMTTDDSDAEYFAVLHTPTRRKGQAAPATGAANKVPITIRPSLAQLHDLRATASMDLQPPPPRGTVFEKYAQSEGHGSTHSLPEPPASRKPRRAELETYKRANSSNGHGALVDKPSMADLKVSPAPHKSKIFGWMSSKKSSASATSSSTSSHNLPKPPAPASVRATPEYNKALPSSPTKESNNLTPTQSADDSFKVTSFRHVRPVSPGPSVPYGKPVKTRATASPSPVLPPLHIAASSSTTSLATPAVDTQPLPIPRRRRQESFGSDGSQKVTVAAFRQAQARRSSTNLALSDSPLHGPVTGLSPPAPISDLPSRTRTPPGRPLRNQPPPSSIARSPAFSSPKNSPRTSEPGSRASWSSATQSDTDDTSTAGESVDLARQSTVRQRPRSATISHIVTERRSVSGPTLIAGPRPVRTFSRPLDGESSPTSRYSKLEIPPRSQSQASGSLGGYTQSWASRSASALPGSKSGGAIRSAPDSDTDEDEDSDSDSEENVPLTKLAGPARPGTSMSQVSAAPSRLSIATAPAPRERLSSLASSSRNVATSATTRAFPGRSSTTPLVNLDSKSPVIPPSKRPTHPVNSRSADSMPRVSEEIRSSQLLAKHPLPSSRPNVLSNHANRVDSSPASSTGDSSSGKLPLTPRDGSEPGSSNGWAAPKARSSIAGNLNGGGRPGHQAKKNSVSFEMPSKDIKESPSKPKLTEEELARRERRRSETKAAIELGNVVNGPPPIVEDDHDMFGQLNLAQQQQMHMQNWEAWQAQARMSQAMFSTPPANPGFQMPPPGVDPNFLSIDPNFLAAHQQAMFIAKQTYQMAVAQQALQAANDEWERSSNVTGYGRQGSVYGGPTAGSVMGGYGMGMPMGGGGMFPAAPASMYGGGGSVMGGPPSAWGGGSVYGEPAYAAPTGRWSRNMPFPQNSSAMSEVGVSSSGRPRQRTRTSPSNTPPAVVSSRRGNGGPSSWKPGQS